MVYLHRSIEFTAFKTTKSSEQKIKKNNSWVKESVYTNLTTLFKRSIIYVK